MKLYLILATFFTSRGLPWLLIDRFVIDINISNCKSEVEAVKKERKALLATKASTARHDRLEEVLIEELALFGREKAELTQSIDDFFKRSSIKTTEAS